MLNVMRENLRHLKWVLWLTAISMVLYLGSYFACGGSAAGPSAWAARVNGVEIDTQTLRRYALQIERSHRDLLGENYEQLRPQLRIGSQAIQLAIQRELVLQDAERLGLAAVPEDIVNAIQEDVRFLGPDGRFIGREKYTSLVERGVPGGVTEFETAVAEDVVIEKWRNLIRQSVSVGEDELEKLFRERTEKTAINYVIVRSSDQDFDTEVADDDVQGWYDSHLDDYHRDDGLRVRYVVVDRADLMTQIEITDEELRQHYEENQANYTRPEMREARHILFRVDPNASDEEKQEIRQNAETTRQRVLAGEDFAELARVLSEDEVSGARGGDLGMFPRERMVPPFSEAAFNTAVGELAPVTETQFGFHVIEVTGEQTAGTTPLEEVTQSLRQTLTVQRAQERVADEARRLRDAITTPDVFDEIADREGLIIESAFVTGDDRLVALGASPDFVPTLFDIGPGSVSEPLNVRSGLAIVAVDVEVPAGVAPIDEIRNEIATDVLNDRARARALESARTSLDARR
jgi:peptidyl-prolyl cis-trans isomerase D